MEKEWVVVVACRVQRYRPAVLVASRYGIDIWIASVEWRIFFCSRFVWRAAKQSVPL